MWRVPNGSACRRRRPDGRQAPGRPGHEVVGRVVECGSEVTGLQDGQRVGVPWLGYTCGVCVYCMRGCENLCDRARFTGYDLDGGYAEYLVADDRYCFALPDVYGDAAAAPLLCAGLIGYRSLRMAGDARRLGIYGFGAAAHIVAQVARSEGREIYAFTRRGDAEAQAFALETGSRVGRGFDFSRSAATGCGNHFCARRSARHRGARGHT